MRVSAIAGASPTAQPIGIQTSVLASGNTKPAGSTPTTVKRFSSSESVRPMTLGSPLKSVRQSACEIIASGAWLSLWGKSRPMTGETPSTANRSGVVRVTCTSRGARVWVRL